MVKAWDRPILSYQTIATGCFFCRWKFCIFIYTHEWARIFYHSMPHAHPNIDPRYHLKFVFCCNKRQLLLSTKQKPRVRVLDVLAGELRLRFMLQFPRLFQHFGGYHGWQPSVGKMWMFVIGNCFFRATNPPKNCDP